MITYKQLSLTDIIIACQKKIDNDKYKFLSILDKTINIAEIVPVSFISYFFMPSPTDPLASSLSDAKGSVITAYFLDFNHITLNCILKILSGIKGFL